MVIQTNNPAINAHRNLRATGVQHGRASQRLSGGYRINSAADDAAGHAISEKMRTQIRGLNQADRNVRDGISLVQVADGALQTIHDILHRMRELSVQAANDTNIAADRKQINAEYDMLRAEIDSIVHNTEFNGVKPLLGIDMEPVVDAVWSGAVLSLRQIFTNVPSVTIPSVPLPNAPSAGTVSPPTPSAPAVTVGGTPIAPADITAFLGLYRLAPPDDNVVHIDSGNAYSLTPQAFQNLLASGISSIVIDAPGRMVVNGNVTVNSAVTFSGDGAFRVSGNVSGAGTITIGSGVTSHIAGNVSNTVANNGHLLIEGSAGTVTNNGDVIVQGTVGSFTNNASARAILQNAANANITNTGHMQIFGANGIATPLPGSGTLISNNFSPGQILVSAGTGVRIGNNTGTVNSNINNTSVTTNNGAMRINGNSATVAANNSNGHLIINGNNARITSNAGRAQITGSGATVTTNQSGGHISIDGGDAQINTNAGTARIIGIDAIIGTNSGNLTVNGINATLTLNTGTGLADIDGANASVSENRGQLRIIGNDAFVQVNNNLLRIAGHNAEIEDNNGHAHVIGNTLSMGTNTGRARIEGGDAQVALNTVGAEISIIGNNSTVVANSGDVAVNGNHSTVETNSATGRVRFDPDNNATVESNYGRIEVSNGSTVTKLVNHYTGDPGTSIVLVESGGAIDAPNSVNRGLIEVNVTATIHIKENEATGRIISHGFSTLDTNRGYLEVGIWVSDAATPPQGSPQGGAVLTTNDSGIIRNFSANLSVKVNISGPFAGEIPIMINGCICVGDVPPLAVLTGGRIENYGTLLKYGDDEIQNETGAGMPLPGEVRHHARQPDVSGLSANEGGAQILKYWANGQEHEAHGTWINSPEGRRRLVFDNDLPHQLGSEHSWVVFNASPSLAVPGTLYDIHNTNDLRRPTMDIAGSTGTSGRYLVFAIHTPFVIQSGANARQTTEIVFRGLNPEFLGGLAGTCSQCVCTLATTNVLKRLSATCSISVIDRAVSQISPYRVELGVMLNRLEFTSRTLSIGSENLSTAESRISNADMAKEMMNLTKSNVLRQASITMLAQANQSPQAVLQLLQ